MATLLWQVHLVFAASFAAVWIWNKINERFNAEGQQAHTLNCLRVAFVCVLILPFLCSLFSHFAMQSVSAPELPFHLNWDTLSDNLSTEAIQSTKSTQEKSAIPSESLRYFDFRLFFEHSMLWISVIWISVIWISVIWFLICAVKLIHSMTILRNIILRSVSIRRVGRVSIATSEDAVTPFAVWFPGRSWIIVPTRLLEKHNDFRMSVLHELQHHRQHDTRWLWLIQICDLALGWSPAFWGWRRLFLIQHELACDESLLNTKRCPKRTYALFLWEQASRSNSHAHLFSAGLLSQSSASILERRIRSMTVTNSVITRGQSVALGFSSIVLGILVASVAFAVQSNLSNPQVEVTSQQINDDVQSVLKKSLLSPVESGSAAAGIALVARASDGVVVGAVGVVRDPVTQAISWKDANWALTQNFEPASLIKPVVAAAALQMKKATPTEHLDCPNTTYKINDRKYHNWKDKGLVNLTLAETVAQSGDVCNLVAAKRIGFESLTDFYSKLGLSDAQKLHGPDALERAAMGVGWTTTAGRLVNAYRHIVMSGTGPKEVAQKLRPDVSSELRTMLQKAVREGTGRKAATNAVSIGGKTGTALYDSKSVPSLNIPPRKTGYFVGIVPANQPKMIGFVLLIQPPQGQLGGGALAAPVFREIAVGSMNLF